MTKFLAALASGLAVTQTAQGAQSTLSAAVQRPPVFAITIQSHAAVQKPVACASRVENHLFDPPNAIKVGASSDLERSGSLNPCPRRPGFSP